MALRSSPPRAGEMVAVLLALDGVRWQEVLHGVDRELARAHQLTPSEIVPERELMPNLHALSATRGALLGAEGGEIHASGPNFISLPSYAEMLSGVRAPGCENNQCKGISVPTLLDELSVQPNSRAGDAAAITSWAPIERVASLGLSSVVLSTGRFAGKGRADIARDPVCERLLREAERADPYPGHGDFRPDVHTANIALRYLSARTPRLLFIGLGETDEFGHRNDYRGYLRALSRADLVIGQLAKELDLLSRRGARTALLVTTDHGRARNFVDHGAAHPESARLWLFATGTEIHARRRLSSRAKRRLADLAPTLRVLLGVKSDPWPGSGAPIPELLAMHEPSLEAR